ncbi:MAG: hypothetical protein B7Y88_13785 [Sphingomonadales bacterium 32-64-17]|nr:MAG: hypothetical protein B7Y88_13785 [Sphingomonadales bacterium 32-64-17]
MEVSEIADRFNQLARELVPELLPNGRRAGNLWMASGIADTGRSESLAVNLSGAMIGHWKDHGNAHSPEEEKGDLLDLLRLTRCNGDAREALAIAKSKLGIVDDFKPGRSTEKSPEERERLAREARRRAELRERELEADRIKKSKRGKALFLGGKPIEGTPGEDYLLGRSIKPAAEGKRWPGSLRFEPKAWYAPLKIQVPTMLGTVVTAAGEQIGCHRTFLACTDGRWGKIDHDPPRMMLGCKDGGFIPISQGSSGRSMRDMPEGEPVYATEGIENALCVRMLKPEARIIAAIDLGNLRKLVLPEKVRELVIVGDRDEGEKQQAALERAMAAQQARGLTVRLVLPPAGINDINDWVKATALDRRRA